MSQLEINDPTILKWEIAPPIKRVRHRSKEKQQEQLDEILTIGRNLFSSQDRKNFSLRQLARQCNMTVGNLYGYVDGKRELWYAIRNRDFLEMEPIFETVVQEHKGSVKELFLKLCEQFILFSRQDYERFKRMFSKNAPPSKVDPHTGDVFVGPYEEETRGAKILDGLAEVIERGVVSGEFKQTDSGKILYLITGCLQGNVLTGRDYVNLYKKKDSSEFDEFLLSQLKFLIANL